MSKLSGKTAIVTGSSRGIGAGIARRLAADGAAVAVNYAGSGDAARAVAKAITDAGGKAVVVQADLSTAAGVTKLFDESEQGLGKIDILVNNAGVFDMAAIADVTEAHYDKLFDVNVKGVTLAMAAAGKRLRDGGRIINITSQIARWVMPGASVYSATKAAVEQLTRIAAIDLGARRITVNAVAPGTTATEMLMSGMTDDVMRQMVAATALGRLGEPADIADVVAFLASEDARWVTGAIVDANGGLKV